MIENVNTNVDANLVNQTHGLSVSQALIDLGKKYGPIRTVYDCGSRDARDGLRLLEAFGANELHVFECNPPAIEICRSNIAKSPWKDRVKLNPLAVADTEKELSFFSIDSEKTKTPHKDGNIGASSLLKANPDYPHEQYVQKEIKVRAVSIDSYCKENAAPDLLWLDLQGAEVNALKGAKNILPRVKMIHTEVSFRSMYIGQDLFKDIYDFLKPDFELVHLDLGRWPKLPRLYSMLKWGPWVGNGIFVNRELLRNTSH